MTKKPQAAEPLKIIAENRKARFNYHIIDTFEAGIVLTGAEIKAMRETGVSIAESYVRPERNEVFLLGAHIKPYSFSGDLEYNPTRKRKLLLNRSEIEKLSAGVDRKGFTVVALKVYLKNGYAKVEIALAKGKDAPDKRHAVKEREAKREIARSSKQR